MRNSACGRVVAFCFAVTHYPLYPLAPGAMLNSSLATNLQLPVPPDILLLPSDLNSFAKLVYLLKSSPQGTHPALAAANADQADAQVVCVNPGRLTKGAGGGTFTTFQIGPDKDDQAASEGNFAHNVHTRCKVTVIRV